MAEQLTFTFEELVSTAVKVLTILGFSPGEQIQVMGGSGPFNGTQADVQAYLMRTHHRTVYSRCELVFPAAHLLIEAFGERHAELQKWMKVRHPKFGGESMHSLMTSGRPSDLDRAFELAKDAVR